MTDRLDRFEHQLTSAVARRASRTRRRRTVGITAAAAVTATAGAGAASNTLNPLALFDTNPAMQTEGPLHPTTAARLQLRSTDQADASWSIAAYRANEALCGAIATPALPRPSIVCQGSFPIAEQLHARPVRVLPSALVLGPAEDGRVNVLVYGFADGPANELSVSADDRKVGTLARTEEEIVVPVDRDNPALTAQGRAGAATLPDQLRLHLVAADVKVTQEQASTLEVTDERTGVGVQVVAPNG